MANNLKHSVIRIKEEDESDEKPVVFSHVMNSEGWSKTIDGPKNYSTIVYLGRCKTDGDMFIVYDNSNNIIVFKGHLNSGKY